MKNTKNNIPSKKRMRLSVKSGMPSASLVYVGEERNVPMQISLVAYQKDFFKITESFDLINWDDVQENDNMYWIKVTGVHHSHKIVEICDKFNIHPLIQEDILNTHQRTKIEEFENYLFITFRHLFFDEYGHIDSEQISIVIGRNFLISFQETPKSIFDDILHRIETAKGSIRQKKIDYLLYKIMDTIVDEYFVLIDHLGDEIENVEDEITYKPSSHSSFKIHSLKKNVILIGKNIQPMRDTLNKLISSNHQLLDSKNQNYFKDVYDHAYLVSENIENEKSLLSDLMNIYLSSMSNRLNQVMKVLTIISTIFMPLSFLTGVFGMNFTHFPGMNHPYAYFYFWVASVSIVIVMLIYFKNKKWY
ncbi:MAG: magnesium/cobalt transporter CorA [Bacteroidota bacterium]|nr:magnesium/cobalt transporter CorA [Bacteroidota bacterium]